MVDRHDSWPQAFSWALGIHVLSFFPDLQAAALALGMGLRTWGSWRMSQFALGINSPWAGEVHAEVRPGPRVKVVSLEVGLMLTIVTPHCTRAPPQGARQG